MSQPTSDDANSSLAKIDQGNALSHYRATNKQLVERASTGLALQGVLVDRNEEITLIQRAKLITIEGDIQFVNPSHQGIDRTEEFKSQTKESRFRRVVEKFGSSISVSAKVGPLIKMLPISINAGYEKSEDRDDTTEVTTNREASYYSRVQYAVVPTVTCVLTDSQIQLDGDALEALKRIDTQLNQTDSDEAGISNACRNFLRTYGSHIFLGKVTFGGIYLISASLSDFSESQTAEAKKAVSEIIATKFDVSILGVGEGNAAFGQTLNTANQTSNQQSNIVSQVRLETLRFGGSPQAENIRDWKNSLFGDDSTWAVIDRDDLRSLAVWEIICRHHPDEFTSPQRLTEVLRQEWTQLSGLNDDFQYFVSRIGEVDNRIKDFLRNEIPQWFVNTNLPAAERLRKLVELRREVEATFNNKAYWGQEFLSSKDVYEYLKLVSENNENDGTVKELMRQVMTPDDAAVMNSDDYTSYKKVFDWINKSKDSEKTLDTEVRDVDGLLEVIAQLQQWIAEDRLNNNLEVSEAILEQCNKYLVLTITRLRTELRKQNELSELTLLVLLLSLGYIPVCNRNTFQKDFKSEDYQKLANLLEEKFTSPENDREKQEADLLLKVIDSEVFQQEKEKVIEFFNTILRPGLKSPSLQNILSRYSIGISDECTKAREEVEAFINPQEVAQNMSNDLSVILGQPKGEDPSLAEPTSTPPAIESPVPVLDRLLQDLGLNQYYPSKLGREEVYTITKYALAEKPSRKPEKLPLYYLTNLLALNYQARWLKTDNEKTKSSETNEWWFADGADGAAELTEKAIHPLDVMAAVFLCCNPIIRQDLVVKLWECKLAIPLVIQESEDRAPKFFLWAMRALVMNWKKTQGGQLRSEERAIADYPMQTVSFIRFDRAELSKSALLNAVMLGNNPHDIFFHKNSEASNHSRQLAEGMVELAWHLPEKMSEQSGLQRGNQDLSTEDLTKESDQGHSSQDDDFELEDITAFVNLRGDVRKYPQQLELIKQISSHVVIFTSSQQLENSSVQIVSELLAAGKAVILLWTNKNIQEEDKEIIRQFMANFQNERERITLISVADKSEPKIRDEVQKKLRSMKSATNSKISLEELARIMQQQGMEVDEEDIYCQQGMKQATEILKIVRQHPKEQRKAELLPLQSKWWKEWAQADKEAVRQKQKLSTEDSGEYANRQNSRKGDSRQQQREMIQQGRLPNVTQNFLKALFHKDLQVREYFVRQLKLGLDALSRAELPDLYAAYGEKMKHLGQYQTSPESAKSESKIDKTDAQRDQELKVRAKINQELKEIDAQITAQSFGLEHLLREIGQVYLALTAIEPKDRSQVEEALYQNLPRISAELLLSGYPLEIMDGEVSSVPLVWVQAVLTEFTQLVQQQGIENPRIFTLSAMGIQSSGKSTLLNVMFGLQFAVSAGRCTKGIYLQTVKLDRELREELQVDYIFVIDTEGIKSLEQSLESETEHDNELSTFVIGLSDLSLIKISGENSTYLQDTLPISVQAFLRMRQVNLKPKVKVIHRNIDTSSTEKLDKQNVSLNMSLDRHTEIACQNERQPVRTFRDIIEFDLKDDVKYLGTLYGGVATRNPIDPDYSKSVKRLKSEIIYGIASLNISSVHEFMKRIGALWDGIKNDNFVYEFKNVVEIQAYTKLKMYWNKIAQEFTEDVSKVVNAAYNEIDRCSSVTYLSSVADKYEKSSSTLLETTWLVQHNKLKDFFQEFEKQYGSSAKQWEASTFYELDDLRDRLRRESRQHIQHYQDSRKAELISEGGYSVYKDKITEGITTFLVSKIYPHNISHRELREDFEKVWKGLIGEILLTKFPSPQILLDAEDILRNRYRDIYNLIVSRKGSKSLSDYQIQNFYGSINYYLVNESKKSERADKSIKQEIQQLKDGLLGCLKRELYQRERQLKPYDPNYLSHFLAQTTKYFEAKNQDLNKKGFSLTRECQADLFIIICGYAIRQLEKIDEKWRATQDPIIRVEQEKESFWLFFLANR